MFEGLGWNSREAAYTRVGLDLHFAILVSVLYSRLGLVLLLVLVLALALALGLGLGFGLGFVCRLVLGSRTSQG